ncbi:MAG: DegT/DnrJ/EryC1/StrS family aminotransferase [Candidatus Diapherotrites archaeon]
MRLIKVGEFVLGEEEKKAVNEVLDSGWVSEGPKTREFEEKWSQFVGTKYCIAVNSGTSALMAGLTALKYFKELKGKKIITTPITYIATTNAIVNTQFEPVFVDIDSKKFVINPKNIKEELENSKDPQEYSIILPVHLMGYPADMDKINKIAKEFDLITFEDSAQAHGTIYKGKKTGSLSLLSDFSFYIAHNIQVGEMGAITTNDKEIARLVKKIKAHGRMCDCSICTRPKGFCPKLKGSRENEKGEDFDPRFKHDLIGYNFKTTEFQAALGLAQLKKADEIISKRQFNVKYLNEGLQRLDGIIQLPEYSDKVSYLAYPLVIKETKKISRKELRKKLEEKGIETRPLFGCIPIQQEAYANLKHLYEGKLKNAEYVGTNGFYVGCHQYLSIEDLDYITKAFKEILK